MLYRILFFVALLVVPAYSEVECYHQTSGTEEGSDDMPTHGECKFCIFQNIYRSGSLFRTDRACGDQCEPVEQENMKKYCCETELCNKDAASAGGESGGGGGNDGGDEEDSMDGDDEDSMDGDGDTTEGGNDEDYNTEDY